MCFLSNLRVVSDKFWMFFLENFVDFLSSRAFSQYSICKKKKNIVQGTQSFRNFETCQNKSSPTVVASTYPVACKMILCQNIY